MKKTSVVLLSALALAACSQDASAPVETEVQADTVAEAETTGEGDRSLGDPAGDSVTRPAAGTRDGEDVEEPSAFEQSIPQAIRGKWRETDGPAPTAAQCDGTADGNIGKVLEVRADGFSIFETGGRLLAVADRSAGMIRATYDTTYADEQTRGDITFRVDPVAKTLTMIDNDAPNAPYGTRIYKRCP